MRIDNRVCMIVMLCLWMTIMFCSCSALDEDHTTDGGMLLIQLKWPATSNSSTSLREVRQFPLPDVVASIEISVLDEVGAPLVGDSGETLVVTFNVNEGSGTINGIPTGANRMVLVKAFDVENALKYQGSQGGILIEDDKITEVQNLEMTEVVSDDSSPESDGTDEPVGEEDVPVDGFDDTAPDEF